jgi:drug/metabolite transporter (DMT)-like permease
MSSGRDATPDTDSAPPKALWHRYAWVAYLAVFIGVIGHASSEFVAKLISENSDIAGPEISVWRFFLGGLGLVGIALALPSSRDLVTPMRQDGWTLIAFSGFGVAAAYLFFHWSLDYASVPQVATVVTTAPIFVGLINMVVNKIPISTAKLVSGIGAVLAVAFLVTGGALSALAGSYESLIGIGMAVLCALLMSAYLVLAKPYVAKYGALRMTAITLGIGGAMLWLGVGLLFGRWVDFTDIWTIAPLAAIAIVVLALYNTTLTQWLWIGGLAAAPDITRAMYLFFLKPVIAAALAVAFLGTELTLWQVLAIAVICLAVFLEANWDRFFKPARTSDASPGDGERA